MNRYESNIKKARQHAFKALKALQVLNSKGEQYDMTNQPNSDDLDACRGIIGDLDNIYYQKV